MNHQPIHNPFKDLPAIEPSAGLLDTIMRRIDTAMLRRARQKMWLFSALTLASLAALIPTIKLLITTSQTTGFYTYASLLLSDHSTVLTYWQDFTLSLLESMPTMAIALTLSVIIAMLLSLKVVMTNRRVTTSSTHS